jgi:hypothetical protein
MVSARTTILLVDDQHLLRLGFGLMFEAEPDLESPGRQVMALRRSG